jgi:hypothetical protein
MSVCNVDAQHRARAAAELVAADPRTRGVDVLAPRMSPDEVWTVELTIAASGVPPGIMSGLAEHRLTADDVTQQGPDHVVVTATVREQ